ncbi:hypothetical protein LFL96_02860 [Paraburkholderia sp. D15]|nr:hypothetical protein [Paraburkholderia sp. D15]WGS50468.1 hypothetical protein LFL96_02860 [Paraburkholderia sp. D15]
MSQSNPQQGHALTTQSNSTATTSFAASLVSVRTVALSLLVDRALSA